MSDRTRGVARALAITLCVSIVVTGPVGAQSPLPPATVPPTATPGPTSGIEWPRMMFAGGDASLLVFPSDCGVWGKDPITLQGNAYVTIIGRTSMMQIEHTLDLYYAQNEKYPANLKEFMDEIIKPNGIAFSPGSSRTATPPCSPTASRAGG